MANGETNGKVSKWVIGILMTVLLFMAGLQFGQSTVKPDISANSMRIEVNSTKIQAMEKTLDEIKAGIVDVNKKLDTVIMQGKR